MGETRFTSAVVKALNKRDGVFAFNVHGSSYLIGHPDIVGSCDGLAFAIETKAGKKKLSKVQESVKRKMEAGGYRYFVVRDWDGYYETLEAIEFESREIAKAMNFIDMVNEFTRSKKMGRIFDGPPIDTGHLS